MISRIAPGLPEEADAFRNNALYARSLIEASLDPLVTISADGKIMDVNRATEEITGLPRAALIGSDFCDYFTEPAKAREGYLTVFSRGEVKDYPLAIRHTSGQITDVLYNASVYRDAAGNVAGVFAAARDITEKKRAEDKLRAASIYARSLIEASLDPLVTISADGKIMDVNRATELVTGNERGSLIGSDFSDYFTAPEKAREGYQTVFRKGFVTDYPLAIRHASGHVTDVLYNASVYRDEAGQVAGVFAAARDITEKKRAEERLRAASLYARSLIEASLDPLVTIDADGKITDVNAATIEVTGRPREALIGSDFSDYFTEPEQARQGYQTVFREGFVTDYPLAIRHVSGRIVDVLYNASVYRDAAGKVAGVFAAARDITGKKRAEERLRAASLYARSLIEASLDPLVTIDADGKITDVNAATIKVTGRPREALIGSDFSDYFTEPQQAREGYRTVFREGFVTDYPLAIRHVSGRIVDVLYNASLYRDEAGNVVGVFAAARDITERKRTEGELTRFKYVLDNTLDMILMFEPDSLRLTYVNNGVVRSLGYTVEELLTMAVYDIKPEYDAAAYHARVAPLLNGEAQSVSFETVHRRRDGSDYPVEVFVQYVRSSRDGRGLFVSIVRDITERKRAEANLRRQSDHYETLLRAASDGILIVDENGIVQQANDAYSRMTGMTREQLLGTSVAQLDAHIPPEQIGERVRRLFHAPGMFETRHHCSDGSIIDVEVNSIVVDTGEQRLLYNSIRDITARKQAEQQVREASRYARSLIEASLDPLVTISADGKIMDVNEATIAATGVARERLVGSDFSEYFTDPELARAGYRKVFQDGYVTDYPLAIRHVSGRITEVLYNASVYRDERGVVAGVFASARDITERKRAEDELRRAHDELELRVDERTRELAAANAALQADIAARKKIEEELRRLNETLEQRVREEVAKNREKDLLMIQQSRLAAMGEMIGNIAHQWRQPLNALGLVLSNIQDAYEFKELSADYLRQCTQNGERLIQKMSSTINDFRNFFLPDKEMRAFSARDQIEEAIALVSASFKNNNIDIQLVDGDDLQLLGFPNEYSQVLLNILSNAKEAIKARNVERGIVRIRLRPAGEFGCVAIGDNGGGIPADILDKIFEPYFSTKPMGTGIGLYMSKMIIERNMHGRIDADNTAEGAEFALYTPLAPATAQGNNHAPA